MFLRKSRGLQRQNVVLQHFVCIAQRVTGHGVNSNLRACFGCWKRKTHWFVGGFSLHLSCAHVRCAASYMSRAFALCPGLKGRRHLQAAAGVLLSLDAQLITFAQKKRERQTDFRLPIAANSLPVRSPLNWYYVVNV